MASSTFTDSSSAKKEFKTQAEVDRALRQLLANPHDIALFIDFLISMGHDQAASIIKLAVQSPSEAKERALDLSSTGSTSTLSEKFLHRQDDMPVNIRIENLSTQIFNSQISNVKYLKGYFPVAEDKEKKVMPVTNFLLT